MPRIKKTKQKKSRREKAKNQTRKSEKANKKQKIKAIFTGENIYSNKKEAFSLFEKSRFGEKKEGKIFMEFDHPQKNQVRDILKKHGYTNYEFKKDQFNKWRYLEKTRHCEERV